MSKVLGLCITLDEQNHLLFYDLKSGERLLSDQEVRRKAEAKNAQLLFGYNYGQYAMALSTS